MKLPEKLLQSLHSVKGFNEEAFVDVHRREDQVVSVRFNPSKLTKSPESIFPGSEKIPWSSYGYYLPVRPSFTLDPLLHAGAYYVQEASSMFIEQCVAQHIDVNQSLKVLDLCAAPGGKSTLLQSMLNSNSLLVSNEVIKTRVNVLVENLLKWGAGNVIITNNDPRDFSRLPNYFDVMVVDAPCSGSGLLRRDPQAISEWSADAVAACSLRQQRILSDAYSTLKNEGLLVYSTCSYSKEENEDICDWLMENFQLSALSMDIVPEWNIVETTSSAHNVRGYRFFPDRIKGEGFFVACFRKKEGDDAIAASRKNKLIAATKAEYSVAGSWLRTIFNLRLFHHEEYIFAFPENLADDLAIIRSNLYIRKSGVEVGKMASDQLIPSHDLAVSTLCSDAIPRISLKKQEAVQYLRKEEVSIKSDKKGWALVQYEDQNIGWVKLLGNRTNNYYPKEWRILKSAIN